MIDTVFIYSTLAFSVIISGELGASAKLSKLAGNKKLLVALDVVFWTSLVGFSVLPAVTVYQLIFTSVTSFDFGLSSFICLLMLILVIGLINIKLGQKPLREDAELKLRIQTDKQRTAISINISNALSQLVDKS